MRVADLEARALHSGIRVGRLHSAPPLSRIPHIGRRLIAHILIMPNIPKLRHMQIPHIPIRRKLPFLNNPFPLLPPLAPACHSLRGWPLLQVDPVPVMFRGLVQFNFIVAEGRHL